MQTVVHHVDQRRQVLHDFFSVNQKDNPCLCLLDSASPKDINSLDEDTKPDEVPEQLQYPFLGENNISVLKSLQQLTAEAENKNLNARYFVILDDQTLDPDAETPSCLIGGEDINSEEKHILFVRAAFKNVNMALSAYYMAETSISDDLRSQEVKPLEF